MDNQSTQRRSKMQVTLSRRDFVREAGRMLLAAVALPILNRITHEESQITTVAYSLQVEDRIIITTPEGWSRSRKQEAVSQLLARELARAGRVETVELGKTNYTQI